MLELPNVTLCCVDTAQPRLALRALHHSMRQCRFGRVRLLTSAPLDAPGIEIATIPELTSREAYSRFVLKALHAYIDTAHVLLVQWDGYVVNAAAWRPDFIDCDYIGAKWFWHDDGMRVGNGGFSLRSRKLLDALRDPRIDLVEAEDVTIGRAFRPLLEREYHIRYGTDEQADAFAFEAAYPVGMPFGFHGLFNFCRVMSEAELVEVVPALGASIATSPQFLQLGRNCRALGWWRAAAAVYAKVVECDPGQTEAAASLAGALQSIARHAGTARNDPCPCGSGRRFKQCHGLVSTVPPSATLAASTADALPSSGADRAPSREDLVASARQALARKDHATALPLARALVEQEPGNATSWDLLGLALQATDALGAETAFARAQRIDPRNPDVLFHLGNLHRAAKRPAQAIECYAAALSTEPRLSSVRNNLALALVDAGEPARAIDEYQRILELEPTHRIALANLSHLLCSLHRYRDAEAFCSRYLERYGGDDAEVLLDHANCRRDAGDDEAALNALERAHWIAADDAHIAVDLASMMSARGEYGRADALLGRALGAEVPQPAYARALLAHCRQQRCAWDDLARLHEAILADVRSGDDNAVLSPFTLLSVPAATPEDQLATARRWARASALPRARYAEMPSHPGVRRPTRIGYLSSDLCTHSIAFLLAEVWERHDRSRFETIGYSIGGQEPSVLRARVERAFDRFRDCGRERPQETAARIHDDAVDVLIDLNGYTRGARSEIVLLRPARIQISWLGYLGTMGTDAIDYVLTDRHLTPQLGQRAFDERFLFLPECYCPSDTTRMRNTRTWTRADCGLPEQGFVFACFNQAYKILPATFASWMRLLAAVPGSILWLAVANQEAELNLRREARARDIDPQRLIFASRVPLDDHFGRHAHVDLLLDTWPYGAGTVANDALLAGVPIVTLSGATMASRVAASQVRTLGLDELVAHDLPIYEAIARGLALDPVRLRALRRRLASARATSPLFDMERFTRDLEAAIESVSSPSGSRRPRA